MPVLKFPEILADHQQLIKYFNKYLYFLYFDKYNDLLQTQVNSK